MTIGDRALAKPHRSEPASPTSKRPAPPPVDSPGHSARAARRSRFWLFGIVLACYLSAPNVTNTDAYLAVPTAVSIVHSADLDLEEFESPVLKAHHGYVEFDGRHYDYFPWPGALLFVPAVVVVDALGLVGVGAGAETLVEANRMGPLQLVTASVVTALAAVVVAAVGYERLRGSPRFRRRVSAGVALVFALGTAAWSTTSRSLWQHGPSMLALALALLAAQRLESGPRSRSMAAALGAAVAGAYVLRPTNAIAVVAFGVLVVVRHRRSVGYFILGLLSVLGVFAAVNLAAYHRPLPPYFSASRISLHGDYLEALAANLVSPARGILVFSPVVVLSVVGIALQIRRGMLRPLEVVAAACVLVQLLVVSAQNEGWWAGHAFGPRFMSDVLPFLAYLAIPAVEELLAALRASPAAAAVRVAAGATVLTVALSVVINAQGAYLRSSTCWNARPVNVDFHPDRVWDLDHPQVLAGYRAVAKDGLVDAMLGPCGGAR